MISGGHIFCRNQFFKNVFCFSASPPSECPMHRAEAGPVHQDRAYEFVECPMKAAAGLKSDIDPANMVSERAEPY